MSDSQCSSSGVLECTAKNGTWLSAFFVVVLRTHTPPARFPQVS